MKIEKVLNNNVVIITGDTGQEKIVMGLGIGFQKKIGDQIDENKIEKEFVLANPDNYSMFQELIVDIPMEYLQLTEEIVRHAKTYLGKRLNESLYIALVDHIYTAVKRTQEGIDVQNKIYWEIMHFYPDEFFLGQKSVKRIFDITGVQLSEHEAAFIALHIVNAESDDSSIREVYNTTKAIQEILNIVKYHFHIEFDESSVYYYRFLTHLKFFAQRMIQNNTFAGDDSDDLLDVVKKKYKNSYSCVLKIGEFLQEKYKYTLTDEETLYLTIHVERIVYKSSK